MSAADPRAAVLARLPHRPPLLLVDSVEDVHRVDGGPPDRLVAHVRLPDPRGLVLWQWHDAEAYPTALLLESFAQAAVVLSRWDDPNPDVRSGAAELLAGVQGVEFPHPAAPGQLVRHEVTLLRRIGNTALFGGSSTAAGLEVCRVQQLSVVAADPAVLTGAAP